MKKFTALFLLSVLLTAGCGRTEGELLLTEPDSEAVLAEDTEIVFAEPEDTGLCYVYVCGAVCHPGVYKLPADSRIYEAIDAAGGLTEEASWEGVNQADEIEDGQMILVPTTAEVAESTETDDGRININTASADQLTAIPGIGEVKAKSIVDYRMEQGAFSDTEEIMNISGIGEATYAKIRDYIKVE